MLKSTFQWWYNDTYLENIRATYDSILKPEALPPLTSLNDSMISIFNDTLLNTLIKNMLLEKTIVNGPYYEIFYRECAPASCSYLVKKRRGVIVASLLIVSVCGGLKRGLELITPWIGSIMLFFVQRWRRYRTAQGNCFIPRIISVRDAIVTVTSRSVDEKLTMMDSSF